MSDNNVNENTETMADALKSVTTVKTVSYTHLTLPTKA
ncbi:SSU ribosomal protein S1P [Lactobacillus paracasei ATCC 334] [Lacticaseibacillus rhamnosus]|nr:SSU ribosomal protein S1P [Lactobacillus paracasei ATCC 334] [Lacticaseibacillus rhamnosus]